MGASSARDDGVHEGQGQAGIAGRRGGGQMIASRERAGGDGVERVWCGDDEKLSMHCAAWCCSVAACLPLIAAAPDWAPRPEHRQRARTREPLLSWSLAASPRRVTV
jgi:hypothetical protein